MKLLISIIIGTIMGGLIGLLVIFILLNVGCSKEGSMPSSPTAEPTVIEYPDRIGKKNYRECYAVDHILVKINGESKWIDIEGDKPEPDSYIYLYICPEWREHKREYLEGE